MMDFAPFSKDERSFLTSLSVLASVSSGVARGEAEALENLSQFREPRLWPAVFADPAIAALMAELSQSRARAERLEAIAMALIHDMRAKN